MNKFLNANEFEYDSQGRKMSDYDVLHQTVLWWANDDGKNFFWKKMKLVSDNAKDEVNQFIWLKAHAHV